MTGVKDTNPSPTYRSLFLDKDGAHQKFYGWATVEDMPGLRVLRKRLGIFTRNLMLLSKDGLSALPGAVKRAAGKFGLADVIIHDFDSVLNSEPTLGGMRFRRAIDSERLLNIATFVVNLRQDETRLFSAMSSDYRRKIRKAQTAGLKVIVHEHPGEALISEFTAAYTVFAAERGLSHFDPHILTKMYAQGNALLLVVEHDRKITNYLHLYTTSETGLFMYGVNPSKDNDGAGQFLHWKAICELKMRGFSWYDMGGIASQDRSNGIFNFKEKFGGNLILLGSEWRHVGQSLKPLLAASKLKRRISE